MARIISIVNQKGGVGKTTSAINIGAYLSYLGYKVLLVDIDPQANASSGLGKNIRKIKRGIYDVIIDDHPIEDVILKTKHRDYCLVPSHVDLAGANVELVNFSDREYILGRKVSQLESNYDFIIIDCPPSLGLLTINGIVACQEVIVPVQAEYYALEGLGQLMETIDLIKENLNPDLEILGALITMFDSKYKLSRDVFHELYKYFPNKIFRTTIPRCIKLAESPSHGKSILKYDKKSRGAKAYHKLSREILE
ncbi:MAG: AAA family ATPase [Patescibacteria group bacterium]|nr:AAA family ATPase [Patescibacteria group bacterium]